MLVVLLAGLNGHRSGPDGAGTALLTAPFGFPGSLPEADGPSADLAALAGLDPALPRHAAAAAYRHERNGDRATAAEQKCSPRDVENTRPTPSLR